MFVGNDITARLERVEGGKGKNSGKRKEEKQKTLLKHILYGKPTKKFRDPADILKQPQKGGD